MQKRKSMSMSGLVRLFVAGNFLMLPIQSHAVDDGPGTAAAAVPKEVAGREAVDGASQKRLKEEERNQKVFSCLSTLLDVQEYVAKGNDPLVELARENPSAALVGGAVGAAGGAAVGSALAKRADAAERERFARYTDETIQKNHLQTAKINEALHNLSDLDRLDLERLKSGVRLGASQSELRMPDRFRPQFNVQVEKLISDRTTVRTPEQIKSEIANLRQSAFDAIAPSAREAFRNFFGELEKTMLANSRIADQSSRTIRNLSNSFGDKFGTLTAEKMQNAESRRYLQNSINDPQLPADPAYVNENANKAKSEKDAYSARRMKGNMMVGGAMGAAGFATAGSLLTTFGSPSMIQSNCSPADREMSLDDAKAIVPIVESSLSNTNCRLSEVLTRMTPVQLHAICEKSPATGSVAVHLLSAEAERRRKRDNSSLIVPNVQCDDQGRPKSLSLLRGGELSQVKIEADGTMKGSITGTREKIEWTAPAPIQGTYSPKSIVDIQPSNVQELSSRNRDPNRFVSEFREAETRDLKLMNLDKRKAYFVGEMMAWAASLNEMKGVCMPKAASESTKPLPMNK